MSGTHDLWSSGGRKGRLNAVPSPIYFTDASGSLVWCVSFLLSS